LPEDVDLRDIAHALSNLCRFTGHARRFYSVAEHSVHVSELLEGTGLELAGLLHDASEAYIADVSTPVKRSGEMGKYRTIEHKLQAVVHEAFNVRLDADSEARVKRADLAMLRCEVLDLFKVLQPGWGLEDLPADALGRVCVRSPWSPDEARDKFVERYRDIFNRQSGAVPEAEATAKGR
jgi:hypothetical protein